MALTGWRGADSTMEDKQDDNEEAKDYDLK
jgi:hypothetical protein